MAPTCEEKESWLLVSSRIPPYALIAMKITLLKINMTVSGTRGSSSQYRSDPRGYAGSSPAAASDPVLPADEDRIASATRTVAVAHFA